MEKKNHKKPHITQDDMTGVLYDNLNHRSYYVFNLSQLDELPLM